MTSTIRLYMSMSLDGFITGPDDGPESGLGRGGGRLFNRLEPRRVIVASWCTAPGPHRPCCGQEVAPSSTPWGHTTPN